MFGRQAAEKEHQNFRGLRTLVRSDVGDSS
jgi:hypothetical protein